MTGIKERANALPEITPQLLVLGFLWYVAFLFSTTCHEAAHALVAKMGGDETAAMGGQVSLNPVPHMRREPWGMILIPLISFVAMHNMFGWASAPYDPQWERRHPRRSGWMALAGPAANFTLMLIAVAGLHLGAAGGWFHRDPVTHHLDFAATTLLIFFSLNLLLGTFNLLPVSPLDGSTVILLFMSEKTAQRYLDWLRGNSLAFAGLLVGIVVFQYIYDPIYRFVSMLLLPGQI
ncbi:MAG: site-2 protease family protein [Candidatus Acidiferrum sp.]